MIPALPTAAATSARPPLAVILLSAYAVLMLATYLLWRPGLPLVTLFYVVLLVALPRLRAGGWRTRVVTALALAAVPVLAWLGWADLLIKALPLMISAALAWVFGRTLRPGAEPLVARFVRVIEGPQHMLQPGVVRYVRQVTVFWAALLAGQALLVALLLLVAPGGLLPRLGLTAALPLSPRWVNLYLHMGGYALIALAFAGETAWRRWHMRHVRQLGPIAFCMAMAQRWPQLIRPESEPEPAQGAA